MPLTPSLNKFSTSSQAAINYDYFDISEGTGIVVYQGYAHRETTTTSYGLTTQSLYSNTILSSTGTTGGWLKELDLDFDLSYNLPKDLRGKLKAMFTMGGGQPGVQNVETYVIVKVRKWDGSTETEIANSQSETFESDADYQFKTCNVEVDLGSIQHFKRGETLRITIEVWARASGAGGAGIETYFFHDPKNRTSTDNLEQEGIFMPPFTDEPNQTTFEVHVPYVIEI